MCTGEQREHNGAPDVLSLRVAPWSAPPAARETRWPHVDVFPHPCAPRRDLQPFARHGAAQPRRHDDAGECHSRTRLHSVPGAEPTYVPARPGDFHGEHDERHQRQQPGRRRLLRRHQLFRCGPPSRRPMRWGKTVSINVPAGSYSLALGPITVSDPAGTQIVGAGTSTTSITDPTAASVFVTAPGTGGGRGIPGVAQCRPMTNTHNTAAGPAGFGGAISVPDGNDTLTVSGVVFSGNQASEGGAIYNEGQIRATNTTFSSNSTTGDGGAVYNRYADRPAWSATRSAATLPSVPPARSSMRTAPSPSTTRRSVPISSETRPGTPMEGRSLPMTRWN